ncbi:unnamed protein product [Brassica oleracea]
MVWLAFKDRLSTGVRMRGWRTEQGCVYCGERNEDSDHQFFACPYTITIWMNVAERLLDTNRLDAVLLRLLYTFYGKKGIQEDMGVLVLQWT